MSYLKGVVSHVVSLVPYQVLVKRCSRKMMAMMEVLCSMDKAYLTAGSALSICWTGPLWDGLGRTGLSGTLLYASDKRCVKQFITIVQSPGINNVYKMLLKTKGECRYGISFY